MTYDRRTAAFLPSLKSHPIQKFADATAKSMKEKAATLERYASIISNAVGLRNRRTADPSRLYPNVDKMLKAYGVFDGLYRDAKKEIESYLTEKAHEIADKPTEYSRQILTDADKFWKSVLWAMGEAQKCEAQLRSEPTPTKDFRLDYGVRAEALAQATQTAADAFHQFNFKLGFLTEAKLDAPGDYGTHKSPEDSLEAFMTPQVLGVARSMVSKFKRDPNKVATFVLFILEDVNAHREYAAIMPLLKEYFDATVADEAAYDEANQWIGKVTSAFQWDLLRTAAVGVAMLRLAKIPEAERVKSIIAKMYEKEGFFVRD